MVQPSLNRASLMPSFRSKVWQHYKSLFSKMSGYFLEISWDTILICGMQLSQNQEKDLLYRRKIQKGTNLTINNYQENVPTVF